MKYFTYYLTFLFIVFSACMVYAQKEIPPEGSQPKDFQLPTPTSFTLDNGMKVTLVEYGNLPKVVIRLVIRAGNLNEKENETWIADMTGELLKQGTKNLSAEKIAQSVANMGDQFQFQLAGIRVG